MEKNKLTNKQQNVFEIILKYFKENNQSPTISELAKILKVSSSRTVTQYLESLAKKGYIHRDRYNQRGIVLVRKESYVYPKTIQIHVSGFAGCDNQSIIANPIYDEYVSVSNEILKKIKGELMAIMAVGKSMTAAGIDDGDIVLVEKTEQVKNNDRVLVVVDDTAVIKRINSTANSVVLNPDSKDDGYKPIVMEKDFKVFGKVVEVIKKQNDEINKEEEIIPFQ